MPELPPLPGVLPAAARDAERSFHVVVSGGRTKPTEVQRSVAISVLAWFSSLGVTHMHHGDCVGFDELCHDIVTHIPAARIAPVAHPPIVNKYRAYREPSVSQRAAGAFVCEPAEYLDRNDVMVESAAFLLAAPSGERRPRSGTWYTIDKAAEHDIPALIVMPGGGVACVPGANPASSRFDAPMPLQQMFGGIARGRS